MPFPSPGAAPIADHPGAVRGRATRAILSIKIRIMRGGRQADLLPMKKMNKFH
jgi:hypothetical protein